ncbi:MAG: hypothetical protein HY329_16935 [Chloroflexi bacterium]|nr:hypothetical protein [Chloroflexota bacterium]
MRPFLRALAAQSGRRLTIVAVALLVVLVAGWGAGSVVADRLRPGAAEPALAWDHYITNVAALYARDRNLEAAKESLQALKIPDLKASVLSVALAHNPTGPTAEQDARALRELARALDPDVKLPEQPRVQSSSDTRVWLPFLPWALALFGVVLLGFAVVIARGSIPTAVVSAAARVRDHGKRRSAPGVIPFPKVRPATRESSPLRDIEAELTTAPRLRRLRGSRNAQAEPESGPLAESNRPPLTPALDVEVAYELGSSSLEEIIPIYHPATGKLVGGCGLGTGPRFSSLTVEAYYGFCVWLQDNTGAGETKSMVLASPWSYRERRDTLREFARQINTESIAVVSVGDLPLLHTRGLTAKVEVLSVEFAPPDSYFRRLRLRFVVTPTRA